MNSNARRSSQTACRSTVLNRSSLASSKVEDYEYRRTSSENGLDTQTSTAMVYVQFSPGSWEFFSIF